MRDASAVGIFEMTKEIVFTYRGSWCAEGLRTTWESEWRIVGTRGSVRWDGADSFQAEAVGEVGGFSRRRKPWTYRRLLPMPGRADTPAPSATS